LGFAPSANLQWQKFRKVPKARQNTIVARRPVQKWAIHFRNAGREQFSAALVEIVHIPNGERALRVIRVAFGASRGWVGGYPTANEMGLPPS
jgi:hypothetical protein